MATSITEEEFWQVIEASLHGCDGEVYQDECLGTLLAKFQPEEIAEFVLIFDRLHYQLINRSDLWAAGMLLNAGHGTDDGFDYFRCWLISCGKDVYYQAVNDPDSLAEVEVDTDEEGHPDAEFEEFSYVPYSVYESLTGGKDLYDLLPEQSVEDGFDEEWDETDADNESEEWLKQKLPKLWAKYGHLLEDDSDDIDTFDLVEEAEVSGVGLVRVGCEIFNKGYGKGIVMAMERMGDDLIMAQVQFRGGDDHWMILNHIDNDRPVFSLRPFD